MKYKITYIHRNRVASFRQQNATRNTPKEQPKILSNIFSDVVNSKSNSNCKQMF